MATALLESLRQAILSAGGGTGAVAAEAPPAEAANPYTVIDGPRFAAGSTEIAANRVRRKITEALSQDLQRLLVHGVPGSLLVMFAASGDDRADVVDLLISTDGELVLGVEGNDALHESLHLSPDRQQALVDTLAMETLDPPGWSHALSYGLADGLVGDMQPVHGAMFCLAQFDLPDAHLQLGWNLVLKDA